ncbi:Glutathione transferase GST 23 [Sesamum angolense]|uniref:Probable glutathione S-transferase n=1 Tax=Sesamum angolense TaxID=2727404 RepID=A0AAE2C6J9_9LAMI|nr:Glutathione transferase GST 23 [Sesamum angolense]
MAEELKLFRTWSSRYSLRVVNALKIKGLEYETILEDLQNKSASLLEYNPTHKKVPVLVHNGKPICESLLILEYIDETWKQHPLLPQDPYLKAMARFWAKFGDDKVLPSIWSVFISQGQEQEEAIALAAGNLKFLEELLKGKKFFGGETIGYLDLAFGWMANLISILEEIVDLKLVDRKIFPLLSEWMNSFSDDPVIKECWPPRNKMVEKFKAMREPYLKELHETEVMQFSLSS